MRAAVCFGRLWRRGGSTFASSAERARASCRGERSAPQGATEQRETGQKEPERCEAAGRGRSAGEKRARQRGGDGTARTGPCPVLHQQGLYASDLGPHLSLKVFGRALLEGGRQASHLPRKQHGGPSQKAFVAKKQPHYLRPERAGEANRGPEKRRVDRRGREGDHHAAQTGPARRGEHRVRPGSSEIRCALPRSAPGGSPRAR